MDIAKRCEQNPLLAPKDLKAGINGMEITCLLNPGVFKYQGKIWLLLRVAETVSYTHLRAHETDSYLVCRLLLEKKKKKNKNTDM